MYVEETMLKKQSFSYFFIIVMVVMALGLMFLGEDDKEKASESSPQTIENSNVHPADDQGALKQDESP